MSDSLASQVPPHPHGAMRRSEREITDRAEIDAILQANKVMHLALADQNVPFVVPVFYAYDGQVLYFHSARSGAKMNILRRNKLVCFEVSGEHDVITSQLACDFEAKHRTVIGVGQAVFIKDEAEKLRALDLIVARFTSQKFTYPKINLESTMVIRIDIGSIKGKKHGFPMH